MNTGNEVDGNVGSSDAAGLGQAALQPTHIGVRSLTATPSAVETGGNTTVRWRVDVPENTADFEIKLNGIRVFGTNGTKSFTLTETTTFLLSVETANGEIGLASVAVRVDPIDCEWQTIDPFVITSLLKTAFDARFGESRQLSLREDGTVVTLGEGTINIAVPVTIKVEDWFDADMDIAIQLTVFQISTSEGSPIKISAHEVNLNVSWSFLENLASLGCTAVVGSGMSKIGQVFLSSIVKSELVPKIAQALNEPVNNLIKLLKEGDPEHREYGLVFMTLSPAGLRFKVCPQ